LDGPNKASTYYSYGSSCVATTLFEIEFAKGLKSIPLKLDRIEALILLDYNDYLSSDI
jgi:hypothetical protein